MPTFNPVKPMAEWVTHCQRGACSTSVEEARWRIWNNPTESVRYRDYCIKCGSKIIKANRDFTERDQSQKLQYEVVMPFSYTAYGARFIYAADEHPIPKVWIVLNNVGFGSIAEYCPDYIFYPRWIGQIVLAAKKDLKDDPIVRVIG